MNSLEKLGGSSVVLGLWRLADWDLKTKDLLHLIHQCIDIGVSSFDHADIYGDYSCEKIFGKALKRQPGLRNRIQLISKCGIVLPSEKFPGRRTKIYNYSFEHIIRSVENSLLNLQTDYLDLLLLHRPSPFFEIDEVSKAFEMLNKSGKVRSFGVSNFSVLQFEMLQKHLHMQLITNQVEISPYCLDHFENGNMDFFMKEKISPMAWSPLAGGRLVKPDGSKAEQVRKVLIKIAKELSINSIDILAYAWLFKHPAQIIPVVGSGKIERIKKAVMAQKIQINLEQWFEIYNAAAGKELP